MQSYPRVRSRSRLCMARAVSYKDIGDLYTEKPPEASSEYHIIKNLSAHKVCVQKISSHMDNRTYYLCQERMIL